MCLLTLSEVAGSGSDFASDRPRDTPIAPHETDHNFEHDHDAVADSFEDTDAYGEDDPDFGVYTFYSRHHQRLTLHAQGDSENVTVARARQSLTRTPAKVTGSDFQCQDNRCNCGKAFNNGPKLVRHVAYATFLYPCAKCTVDANGERKRFGSKNDQRRHFIEVHGTELDGRKATPYPCPVESCDRNKRPFYRLKNHSDHMKKKHFSSTENTVQRAPIARQRNARRVNQTLSTNATTQDVMDPMSESSQQAQKRGLDSHDHSRRPPPTHRVSVRSHGAVDSNSIDDHESFLLKQIAETEQEQITVQFTLEETIRDKEQQVEQKRQHLLKLEIEKKAYQKSLARWRAINWPNSQL
jgi:hypothetical protein